MRTNFLNSKLLSEYFQVSESKSEGIVLSYLTFNYPEQRRVGS